MKSVLLIAATLFSTSAFATQISPESIANLDAQLKKQDRRVGSCTNVALQIQAHPLAGEDFEGQFVVLSYTEKNGKSFDVPNMYVNGKSHIESSVSIDGRKKITETIKLKSYLYDSMVMRVGDPGSVIALVKEGDVITKIATGWFNRFELSFNRNLPCAN